jgi:hypothetical protein
VTEGTLLPEAGTQTEFVVLDGTTAAITSGCPAVPATVRAKRNGTTRVIAQWPTATPCAGLPAAAKVKGKIVNGCAQLAGRLKAPRARPKRRSFVALRSTCGDGFVDTTLGEACEGTAAGACTAGCTDACQCVPVPGIFLLTPANGLHRIRGTSPGTVEATVSVSGLRTGEQLVGIDFRPATRQLYALGVVEGGDMDDAALWAIHPETGVATQVGAAPGPIVGGTTYGFDFNPTVDRIRVVNDADANFRLNPETGALSDNDTSLSPISATIIGAAYDRNVAGATQTTLYGLDASGVELVIVGGLNGTPSPNTGFVTAVGSLAVPIAHPGGLDIDAANTAWAVLVEFFSGSAGLYTVDLATGTATLVGLVGDGAQEYIGLAVSPDGAG